MTNCIRIILLLVVMLPGGSASAGLLVTLGPNWNNFVFEPLDKEQTPNYYGYGARLSLGYSVMRVWDLGVYGHYAPGRLNSASATGESARFYHFGGETALRLAKAVYIGARGGPAVYRLAKQYDDTEIPGQWTGAAGQGSLGLILPTGKAGAWQASLDVGQASVKAADGSSKKPRSISEISLTLAFVYNGYQTSAVDTAIFNNWIKNLTD